MRFDYEIRSVDPKLVASFEKELLPYARAGKVEAQYRLAVLYLFEMADPAHKADGIYWLDKAADSGDKGAIQLRESLKSEHFID